ncbi:MAG: hypothetical protein J3K34DRAFT_478171 [Monoraphidium minutum]|nr:MAG: hypothetical protein J3K34DRAFT_478171 [Monoraphidium minutum]
MSIALLSGVGTQLARPRPSGALGGRRAPPRGVAVLFPSILLIAAALFLARVDWCSQPVLRSLPSCRPRQPPQFHAAAKAVATWTRNMADVYIDTQNLPVPYTFSSHRSIFIDSAAAIGATLKGGDAGPAAEVLAGLLSETGQQAQTVSDRLTEMHVGAKQSVTDVLTYMTSLHKQISGAVESGAAEENSAQLQTLYNRFLDNAERAASKSIAAADKAYAALWLYQQQLESVTVASYEVLAPLRRTRDAEARLPFKLKAFFGLEQRSADVEHGLPLVEVCMTNIAPALRHAGYVRTQLVEFREWLHYLRGTVAVAIDAGPSDGGAPGVLAPLLPQLPLQEQAELMRGLLVVVAESAANVTTGAKAAIA